MPPSKSSPSDIIHFCQRFFQSSKHFWYALFSMSLSSLSDSVFISSIVAKRRPFMSLFNLGNRKKSQRAKSGEYGGWGMITVLFLAKKLRTSNDEWASQNSAFWNELRCHTLQTQNILENCMAWANRYTNILSNFSNSDSTILHNNFLHCFSVFIGCWHAGPSRASVVTHLFLTFCEELVPLVNTFSTYSTLTVCHFQHFKCFWALKSIFYTKFDAYSLINFFDSRKSPTHAKHF